MRQYVLSKNYELRQLAEMFPQGTVIRVLGPDDIVRVGDILLLTAIGAKEGEELTLEVTHPVASESATDIDDTDGDDEDEDTAESSNDNDDKKEDNGYW